MYIRIFNNSQGNAGNIVTKCPICGNGGTFDKLPNISDFNTNKQSGGHYWMGQRKCPNAQCHAHLFFILSAPDGTLKTYPSLRIDFNTDKLPEGIRSTFEEAVTCHAEECYVASAIMVRRTLEELCQDKNCHGDNLKKRVEALKDNVVLPTELFKALDELRLLGNDAAHIESKEYDRIGHPEVSIAIEITKEILKSVYQMDALVEKLKNLKKT